MTTSTFPAYVDALKAALIARPGLEGVTVADAPMGDDTPAEAIVLVDCTTGIDWGALGRQRQDEGYTIRGVIHIAKPGAGLETAKAARDQVSALLTELKTAIKDNPQQGVTGVVHSRVSAETWKQGIGERERLCICEFGILVKARI